MIYRAFNAWRSTARRNAEAEVRVRRCVHRMLQRTASLAFYDWLDVVAERHRAEEARRKAEEDAEKARLAWEAKVRRAERFLRGVMNASLSAAFETWEANWRETKAARRKINLCVQRMAKRTLFAAFASWGETASERARRRAIVRRCVERFSRRALATAFFQWRDDVVERNERAIREEEAWRVNVVKCERFVRAMQKRELSAAFVSWEAEWRRLKSQRRALNKCVTRMTKRAVFSAFSAWASTTAELRRQRAIVKRAAAKIARNALASTFYDWQREVAREGGVGGEGGPVRSIPGDSDEIAAQAMSSAFAGWRDTHRKLRTDEVKVARCIQRMTQNVVARAFIDWAEKVEAMAQSGRASGARSRRGRSRAEKVGRR